ncbi:MAG: hypothetical protein QS721_07730 [Candidatus Endonucleobacter sp. (ex Gigantidas childressi)]|nr:hypothetical protein [Candidatus Endonucleobacter sp. (ex Gigantidas childressi)]
MYRVGEEFQTKADNESSYLRIYPSPFKLLAAFAHPITTTRRLTGLSLLAA